MNNAVRHILELAGVNTEVMTAAVEYDVYRGHRKGVTSRWDGPNHSASAQDFADDGMIIRLDNRTIYRSGIFA